MTDRELSELLERRKRFDKPFDREVVVRCRKCGTEQSVNYLEGLKNGWPLCCGHTMGMWAVKEKASGAG